MVNGEFAELLKSEIMLKKKKGNSLKSLGPKSKIDQHNYGSDIFA